MNADHTIRNVSDLQKALSSSLTLQPETNQPTNKPADADTENFNNDPATQGNSDRKFTSKDRIATNQMGSSRLLHNLAGLQTVNNSKLDMMIDVMNRQNFLLQNIYEEQCKQTEFLSSIARNTSINNISNSNGSEYKSRTKGGAVSIKEYGFKDGISLISELIIKLLHEAEIKVDAKNRRYRSTRTITLNMVEKAVGVACKVEFKASADIQDVSAIKIPDNKDPTMVQLASKIGSVDDIAPVLNANALREIFINSEFRVFTTIFQTIMDRLKIIRIMLPYYEADIINAISFPYFDKDGELLCDMAKLMPRAETEDEAVMMTSKVTARENVGKMLAKRVGIRSAIKACIKEKDK